MVIEHRGPDPLDGPVLGTGDNRSKTALEDVGPLDGPVLGTGDNFKGNAIEYDPPLDGPVSGTGDETKVDTKHEPREPPPDGQEHQT